MNEEQCETCGASDVEHDERFAKNAADYVMVLVAARQAGPDYERAAEEILVGWRTHALPECDPLAIT